MGKDDNRIKSQDIYETWKELTGPSVDHSNWKKRETVDQEFFEVTEATMNWSNKPQLTP